MEQIVTERFAPIFVENCLESTNDSLKALARNGAEHGTVLIAREQLSGRGRQGRSFLSPQGGVYLSMLLKPSRPAEECTQLTALAALAVHKALKKVCGVHTDIKWPNDLLLNGKKLCGILTELVFDISGRPEVILGIGINLNTPKESFAGELESIACSVYGECGSMTDIEKMISALIEELDLSFERWEKEGCYFPDEYRQLSTCLNRDVLVLSGEKGCKARALDIASDLSLRVRFEDGSEENLFFGEISLRI